MTQDQPVTVVCQYQVKPGNEAEFEVLLAKHWPALHAAGLTTETPPQHFRGKSMGKPGDRTSGEGTYIEIYEWKAANSAHVAHETPEIMAVWEPMGAICSGMSFPHFDVFTPSV